MKTRGIIGRKIVAIRQSRCQGNGISLGVLVNALVLDDGSELRTHAHETIAEPVGTLLHVRKRKPQPA